MTIIYIISGILWATAIISIIRNEIRMDLLINKKPSKIKMFFFRSKTCIMIYCLLAGWEFKKSFAFSTGWCCSGFKNYIRFWFKKHPPIDVSECDE